MSDAVQAISIVIPAHNEEQYLPKCLAAIARNKERIHIPVETVVVLNRCTDDTEAIATTFDATIIREDLKNIARIRNAGVLASKGAVVITIDADSYMGDNTLSEIVGLMSNPDVVSGGTNFQPERRAFPILLSYGLAKLAAKLAGGSMALYWFRRTEFDSIGGFDESRHVGEDIDFSARLRKHAESAGLQYRILKKSVVTTSCRKFDQFGDWHAIRLFIFNNARVKTMKDGSNTEDMDKFYYEARKTKGNSTNLD